MRRDDVTDDVSLGGVKDVRSGSVAKDERRDDVTRI